MGPGKTIVVDVRSRPNADAGLNTDAAKLGLFAALSQTQVPRGENDVKTLTEHWGVHDFAGPKICWLGQPINETKFRLTVPADLEDAANVRVVVCAGSRHAGSGRRGGCWRGRRVAIVTEALQRTG